MRKTALAAGGLALAIALSACGSESGNAGGIGGSNTDLFANVSQLVDAASAKAEESQSSKFSMEMEMAGMSMSAQGEALYDGPNTQMAMTMDMQGQSFEMRLVDNTMYMKLPEELAAATDGKPWVKSSPDGSDPLSQAMGNMDQLAEQSDPRKTLENIKKAGEITKSEETTLDGQEVTHYWIDIDLAKASDMMGGMSDADAQAIAKKAGKLPMELWLNADNLPVQVTMDMGTVLEAAGAPGGSSGSMIMKYTDWGAPVTVEAPAADQIGEMPAF